MLTILQRDQHKLDHQERPLLDSKIGVMVWHKLWAVATCTYRPAEIAW